MRAQICKIKPRKNLKTKKDDNFLVLSFVGPRGDLLAIRFVPFPDSTPILTDVNAPLSSFLDSLNISDTDLSPNYLVPFLADICVVNLSIIKWWVDLPY